MIVYVTSYRINASGQMSLDVIPEFINQLIEIPEDKKEIDLMIVSNGGDPIVPWRIMSLLRNKFISE